MSTSSRTSKMHSVPGWPERMTTPHSYLRRISESDAAAWMRVNNNIKKLMPSWDAVPSIIYARNELLHYDDEWKKGTRFVYAIVDTRTNKVIGDMHLEQYDPKTRTMEFGHALDPSAWGTGITYEILDVIYHTAKKMRITLWCKVEQENIRSFKSLEKYGARHTKNKTLTIKEVKKNVRIYELPSNLFAQRVYNKLLLVPKGNVTTYRDIAYAMGTRAYRAVGSALKNNPYAPHVPCHRVVASDGNIGGFMGHTTGEPIARKIALLKREDIIIDPITHKVRDFEKKRFQFT